MGSAATCLGTGRSVAMSDLSIPVAEGPHGNPVPIEEAERNVDYYVCPECGEFLTPRIGPKRQYFAHKRGVLDDTDCSLSSRADIEEMVDELRTSDIEESEQERTIRIYIGEQYDGRIECFGILPSLEWQHVPPNKDVDALLDALDITTAGVTNPPVPSNFHPSESETIVPLDPTADEYVIDIEGPDTLSTITGHWSVDGLASGDLFVGDQSRARRHRSNRQIKIGEWVYLVMAHAPATLPDVVGTYDVGSFTVLAFPARESTEELLQKHGEGLTTDDYGFDADVILPASVHPTIEAPTYGAPNEGVLVGITPSEGIDPIFEVVSVPKRANDTVDIEPTGPGNPRFYPTRIPTDGSRRVSIHQRNSNRHRLIHLHPESDTDTDTIGEPTATESRTIGLEFNTGDETAVLSPLDGETTFRVDEDFNPHLLPTNLSYVGPDGLEIEITATFVEDASLGPTLTRFTTNLAEFGSEIAHWVEQGCARVRFEFGGVGAVRIEFPQPALAVSPDSESNRSGSVSSS